MKAEERLREFVIHRLDRDEHGIVTVGACNAYEMAEQAIALLRRYHETLDTIHSFMHQGFDEKCFSCVLLQDGEKYLGGGDES